MRAFAKQRALSFSYKLREEHRLYAARRVR